MSGIHTLEDLRQRCFIDDITECWVWRGACYSRSRPSIWVVELGKAVTIGVFLNHLRGTTGGFWVPTCKTVACVNPAHREFGSRSDLIKRSRSFNTPEHCARITLARRRASPLTADDAKAIRESTETLAVLAARYGVCATTASRIRRQEYWAPPKLWRLAA